jgi:hypothetical protein
MPDPGMPPSRSRDERPKVVARLREVAPSFAVIAVVFSLAQLVRHLVFGGDTSAGHVVLGALVFFLLCLPALLVCDAIARWWHESDDRQAP